MVDIKNSSRRSFLKGVAKTSVLLPFAGQMLSQEAFAAATGYKNILFFYTPNGQHPDFWNPKQGTGPITTTEELSFPLGSLKEWHNNIIVLKNIWIDINHNRDRHAGGGHSNAILGCLTCDYNVSIDHLIAEKLDQRAGTKNGVLNVGVRTGEDSRSMISKPRNAERKAPENNPFELATKLQSRLSREPADPLQTSVYAAVMSDMAAINKDKLSADRQGKLDQHLEALERLKNKQQEGNLRGVAFDFDTKETFSGSAASNDYAAWNEIPKLCRSQINNIVAAFANELHSVATLQISIGGENPQRILYNFDECWDMVLAARRQPGSGTQERHDKTWQAAHEPSHNNGHYSFQAQSRWHNSLIAYTLKKLKELNILDETLIVMLSEEGGNDHTLDDGSMLLAGGTGGGLLKMGRVIDCGKSVGSRELFGDIAKLMGAPLTEGPWRSGVV